MTAENGDSQSSHRICMHFWNSIYVAFLPLQICRDLLNKVNKAEQFAGKRWRVYLYTQSSNHIAHFAIKPTIWT